MSVFKLYCINVFLYGVYEKNMRKINKFKKISVPVSNCDNLNTGTNFNIIRAMHPSWCQKGTLLSLINVPVRLLFWVFFLTSTFITAVRLLILPVFCQPVWLLATGTLISLGASVFSCPVLMVDGPAYFTSLCTVARPIFCFKMLIASSLVD